MTRTAQTNWYWVRHGPTHAKRLVGWTDLPADLSDTAQLARLDAYLPDDALVISSDLSRSICTADAICADRTRLEHEPDLREINFGDWENRSPADVAASDPELSKAFWSEPGEIAPPNGESWDAAASRVIAGVDRLTKRHAGQSVVAVAHFGAILTQVQRAMGGTAQAAFAHKIDNLSVTHLVSDGQSWQLQKLNHLP